MKKIIILTLVLLASATTVASAKQKSEPKPFIEVRGSALTSIAPNKIEVTISLSESQSKGKITLSEQESSLAKALKAADVDIKKQLVVSSQSSSAQKRRGAYQYKNYLLTLYNAEQLATTFDAFNEFGVLSAKVKRTYNDSIDSVRQRLRIEAMNNALSTAKTLSGAVGQSVGSAIEITDYSTDYSPSSDGPVYSRMASSNDSSQSEELAEVSLKPIEISQTLTVRFELLPK